MRYKTITMDLPKVTAADRLIDWRAPIHEICNLARAMTRPYGGAFSDLDDQGRRVRMLLWDTVPFSREIEFEGRLGTVVHELHGKPLVKCQDGILLVRDFTLAPPSEGSSHA